MPKLIHYSEKVGCGVTIGLDSGETCLISVAQAGVLVRSRQRGLVAALIGPFFGPKLYEEKDVYKAANMAMALDVLYSDYQVPIRFKNPVLGAFTNAVWRCATAAEVSIALQSAAQKADGTVSPQRSSNYPHSGDGASPEAAIFIKAGNSLEGIPQEYAELEARFGKRGIDWKVLERFLVQPGDGRVLEKFILSVQGRREVIHFDVSGFVRANGPEEQARLGGIIARHDRSLKILLPKDRAMYLMTILLKLSEKELKQLGWSDEFKNGLVGCLTDAIRPFLGKHYQDMSPSFEVEMMLSQWSAIHIFLRMCEPRDIEQEEELEDLKAFIGGAIETAKRGN